MPSPIIKIRKFKKGDERKLSYLCRKCITSINSKDISKKEAEVLYHCYSPGRIVQDSSRFDVYVAETKGKIIGTASLTDHWVKSVFVNPLLHGKGIGTQLMEYMEKLLKRRGIRSASLKSSPYAINFYKKIGYKKVKDMHLEVGPVTEMNKIL